MVTETATPAVYSIPQAARLLGISKQSAYDLIRRDAFPCATIQCGRRVVIPRAHLDQLLGLADPTPTPTPADHPANSE